MTTTTRKETATVKKSDIVTPGITPARCDSRNDNNHNGRTRWTVSSDSDEVLTLTGYESGEIAITVS